MNVKRLAISAVLTGLLVWGLTEMFYWIIADLIGAPTVARIAPALSGAILGIALSALTQAIRKKRQDMLGEK